MWGVLDIARRWGKDALCLTMAIEDCLRANKQRIPYGAQTDDVVKEILLPTADWILESCPAHLRPVWEPTKHALVFNHNQSRIVMCGLDYRPDRLRGPRMNRGYLSEAGFVRDLRYVVTSIFLPMMQGVKNPFFLMNSTPPVTPQHDWSSYFVPEAQRRGVHIHQTIFDTDRLSDVERAAFIAEAGGLESTTHRRENMAEHVIDETAAVVPEFQRMEATIVREHQRPSHFDPYVTMDIGFHDLTAVLFAYYDFANGLIVVEDEYVTQRTTSAEIVANLREREQALWHRDAYQRFGDAPEIVLADMSNTHRYHVAPTPKDDKDAAVNALRLAVSEGKLIIHPRCEHLRNHLRHAVWNSQRKSYERSGDMGHFDCVDAAVYLVRNVVRSRNPYPMLEGIGRDTHYIDRATVRASDEQANALRSALTPRWKQ